MAGMRLSGILAAAPWRRAPLLLLRRPGVAAALATAALVTALPAAAAPLFLSSAREATLAHRIAAECPAYVGPRITGRIGFGLPPAPDGTGLAHDRTAAADRAARAVPGLGARTDTLVLNTGVTDASGDTTRVTLLGRDGATAHLRPLAPPTGGGVWVPDTLAATAGLHQGDLLTLSGGYTRGPGDYVVVTRRVPVAAIYHDLRRSPDEPYWCALVAVYRGPPGEATSNRMVPPTLVADFDTALATGAALHLGGVQMIEYPVLGSFDQPRATRIGQALAAMRLRLLADGPAFGETENATTFRTGLASFAARADLVRHSLLAPVIPITAAGVLVGLLVVATAAVFWTQRRRTELAVLAAHGVGPAALGVKAVLEAAPALLAGTAGGWLAARALVHAVGPGPALSGEAPGQALLATLGALLAALVVLGTAAALACRGLADVTGSHHRRRLARLPVELLLVAAAVPAWRALSAGAEAGDPAAGLGTVVQVPARLLVVPIMVIVGVAAFAARIATWRLRGGLRHTPRRPAAYLAWRRAARDAGVAAALAAATAVPIAFAAYGGTVTSSVRATLAAQARLLTGADVVLDVARPTPVPASLAGHTSQVLRLNGVQVGGVRADLLAVDPRTFPRDAYWDARITHATLAGLLAGLGPRTGQAFPVVGSDPVPEGDSPVTWSTDSLGSARVRRVDLLPAQQGGYPVLLARTDAIPAALRGNAHLQWWIRGDPRRILRAARAAGVPLAGVAVADDQYAGTTFEALTYTFDYLVALSLLTGLVAGVGLLLYLESRAGRQRRAYVLLRRMGLRPGSHRRAVLLELALPLGVGLLGGFALAAGLALALARYLEVDPQVPPDTVLSAPWSRLLATAVAVAVLGLGAGLFTHRRVARARPMEVLRDVA
jgi:putative ABC transport system permease protein